MTHADAADDDDDGDDDGHDDGDDDGDDDDDDSSELMVLHLFQRRWCGSSIAVLLPEMRVIRTSTKSPPSFPSSRIPPAKSTWFPCRSVIQR